MLNLQFSSAHAVYATFALQPAHVPERRSGPPPKNPRPPMPPVDIARQTPGDHLRYLEAFAEPIKAIDFAAHMLPRREVVLWGYRCAEALARAVTPSDERCVKMVEAWLRDPTEARRRGALQFALDPTVTTPCKLLTMAVAGTSGSLTPDHDPAPPVPHDLTARSVAGAIKLILYSRPSGEWPSTYQACMAECHKLLGRAGG